MESALFLIDIVAMVVLLISLWRAERSGDTNLGFFAFRETKKERTPS